MEQDSIASVKNAYMLRQEHYALFVQEHFEEQHSTISDPLKKNTLPLFSKKRNLMKVDHNIAALKEDRLLFGRLYTVSQNCDGDLQNFFKTWKSALATLPLTVWWAVLRHQVWPSTMA